MDVYIKDLSLQLVQLNSVDGATVLFATYSVYGRIFVHFAPEFFIFFFYIVSIQIFSLKIVLMNSLDGATVLFAVIQFVGEFLCIFSRIFSPSSTLSPSKFFH